MCFSDGLEKDAVTSQACLDALLHFAADSGPGGGLRTGHERRPF